MGLVAALTGTRFTPHRTGDTDTVGKMASA